MRRALIVSLATVLVMGMAGGVRGESKRDYQNRFRMMFDYAVRANEYVRQHLGDRSLSTYAQKMAAENVDAAEQMTPPKGYTEIHPHFLLVLENIERSFYYASKGKLDRYRAHQKTVRAELHMVETLAERKGLQLYLWDRDW